MQNNIHEIIAGWGGLDVEQLDVLNAGNGGRYVYKIKTKNESFILKGQPIDEGSVTNIISAHEYLGNKINMAPRIYHRPNGSPFYKTNTHIFYLMEFIEGRHLQDTIEDCFLFGKALARLHTLKGYDVPCSFDTNEDIQQMKSLYTERKWKREFDEILILIPDFYQYRQCLIHTDAGFGLTNVIVRNGAVIFIDLDGTGIGSPYIDFSLLNFAVFNNNQFSFAFDLAKSYLDGYSSIYKLDKQEYDLVWHGSIFHHIYNMQWFDYEESELRWEKLRFAVRQKDELFQMLDW